MSARRAGGAIVAGGLAAVLLATGVGPVAAAVDCPTRAGESRFAVDGGLALDRVSGLVWRRCALGAEWTGASCTGERAQIGLDAAEAAARAMGEGWRLPDVKELYELLGDGCGGDGIDRTVFADVGPGGEDAESTWTTTPVGLADLWYFVDLASGLVDGHSRSYPLTVRPVRERR